MHLVFLKFVDRELTLVDSDKVYKFAVLFNIDVGLFNARLKIQDILFLALLRFEE